VVSTYDYEIDTVAWLDVSEEAPRTGPVMLNRGECGGRIAACTLSNVVQISDS
jgi:hypothetical protein